MRFNDFMKNALRRMYANIPEYEELAKDRYEAIRTYDVEKMKAFQKKWAHAYPKQSREVSDESIIIAMHKMMCFVDESTEEEKQEARKWLKDRGYSEEIF